ncbi:MAG TPA: hypothetical protein VHM91_13140 [Verrucomicrobiales bacterium]|nr:hypothetical protein [Verrucomicrobiales bacterium]
MSHGHKEPEVLSEARDHYAPPASMKEIPPGPVTGDYGCTGGALGGCLLPVLGQLAAVNWGSEENPFFWPLVGVPLGGICGMGLGVCFSKRRRPPFPHQDQQQPPAP